jgi:hypothetical protein
LIAAHTQQARELFEDIRRGNRLTVFCKGVGDFIKRFLL